MGSGNETNDGALVEFGTGNEEMGEKNYTMYLGLKGACAYCRVESSRSCIRSE